MVNAKKRLPFVSITLLSCLGFLTACSNSSENTQTADETAVINQEDYLRYAVNSLDAYKIACYAIKDGDWIIASQKWAEGDDLSEQEGKLPALGLSQAMEIRLREGESAVWNGAPADEALNQACAVISRK